MGALENHVRKTWRSGGPPRLRGVVSKIGGLTAPAEALPIAQLGETSIGKGWAGGPLGTSSGGWEWLQHAIVQSPCRCSDAFCVPAWAEAQMVAESQSASSRIETTLRIFGGCSSGDAICRISVSTCAAVEVSSVARG